MPFQNDQNLLDDVGSMYGEYLTTFTSTSGQVRADLFRRGRGVVAYVSFPTGLDAAEVTDPYVHELWQHAREEGFQDQFQVVLSS